MGTTYHEKNDAEMQFEENKANIRHVIRQGARRLENNVLGKMSKEFNAALLDGTVKEYLASREEVEVLLHNRLRELADGSEG